MDGGNEDDDDDEMPEAVAWGLEVSPVDTRKSRRGWVWEAGVTTDPLEYPTAAVRRGVVRFHEQV